MKRLSTYIQIARPHQYIKNGFIWLPLFFGHKLADPQSVFLTFVAFLAFCTAASSIYILNDIKDADLDRLHPLKRHRPLAVKAMTESEAWLLSLLFVAGALVLSWLFLPPEFWFILAGYLVLNITYSVFLKHIAIVDVICIAIGFVLRIFAGGVAAGAGISHWMVIMTFLLALFMALAKRRDDLLLTAAGNQHMRKSLGGYNLEFISLSMAVMSSVIIVSYILYTVSPEILEKHGTDKLYLTAFWVVLGVLRYMQVTFVEGRSGSPSLILLKDFFLQAVVALWLACCYVLLYVF